MIMSTRTSRIKFFEHFLFIAEAMEQVSGDGIGLWDEEDEFYYDVLNMPDGSRLPLKVRSSVGLIPLFAVELLEGRMLTRLPGYTRGCALVRRASSRPSPLDLALAGAQPG